MCIRDSLYGNAETKDLWAGISETSGMDVSKIMANWTLKVGFPVITVEELGQGKLKLTQNRFLSTGDVKPEEDETLWWIPLAVKNTSSDGKVSIDSEAVLSGRSTEYTANSDSFKLNADSIGVYRVAYSPERLAKLGQQASTYSVEDRVGLVSDATTLARAGYSKTSGSLALVNALGETETEYLPWSQINAAMGKLSTVWWEQPEPVRKAIDKLRLKLVKPLVQRLGYEHGPNDAPDVQELRALAVSAGAAAEDPDVLAELKRRFKPFLEKGDDSLIPADIQRAVFQNNVKHGGKAEWEKILEVYNKPPNPSTKVDAMYSLCSTRDEELLEKTFKMMGDGSVKDQDLYIFFVSDLCALDTQSTMTDPLELQGLCCSFVKTFQLTHRSDWQTTEYRGSVSASTTRRTTIRWVMCRSEWAWLSLIFQLFKRYADSNMMSYRELWPYCPPTSARHCITLVSRAIVVV